MVGQELTSNISSWEYYDTNMQWNAITNHYNGIIGNGEEVASTDLGYTWSGYYKVGVALSFGSITLPENAKILDVYCNVNLRNYYSYYMTVIRNGVGISNIVVSGNTGDEKATIYSFDLGMLPTASDLSNGTLKAVLHTQGTSTQQPFIGGATLHVVYTTAKNVGVLKYLPDLVNRSSGAASNIENAYTSVDSDTYATFGGSTSAGGGTVNVHFEAFDGIPSDAVNVTYKIRYKAMYDYPANYPSTNILYSSNQGSTAQYQYCYSSFGLTSILTAPTDNIDWQTFTSVGGTLYPKLCMTFGGYSSDKLYLYGAEVDVIYETPAVNKVDYKGENLIDLTQDTVTTSDVLEGVQFHLPNGMTALGELVIGGAEVKAATSIAADYRNVWTATVEHEPTYLFIINTNGWSQGSSSRYAYSLFWSKDGTISHCSAGYSSRVYATTNAQYTVSYDSSTNKITLTPASNITYALFGNASYYKFYYI